MTDPWGTEPQEVAATAAPKYDYEPPAPSGEIVQTVKFGNEYGAPWLVTHGPTAGAVNTIVDTPDYRTLVDTTVKAARFAQGAWSGTTLAKATATSDGNTATKSQPDRTLAPNGEKKYCIHGERTYREGVSKAGKPYKAFFCGSGDKDDQCSPEWAK